MKTVSTPLIAPVGQRELELVAQVGHVADAAQDRRRADLADEVGRQAGVTSDGRPRRARQVRFDQRDALVVREQLSLVGVVADADDHLVEEDGAPLDHVEVASGDRVELAGEDRDPPRLGRGGCTHARSVATRPGARKHAAAADATQASAPVDLATLCDTIAAPMSNAADASYVPPVARRHTAACIVVLILVVVAVFGRLIGSDFTWWDDQGTVHHNEYLNPPTLTTLRYYWTTMPQGLYVPVTYTVWAAIAKVAYVGVPDEYGISLNPIFFHLASVLCHVASVAMVFLILRRLVGTDRPALLGALLFAVHPVQVETVGWVSGFKDVLGWLGSIGVVLLYVRRVQQAERDGQPVWRSWEMPVAALVLILAILSKPTAMVTPAALLTMDGLVMRRQWRRAAASLAPLFAITAGGMVLSRIAQTVTRDAHLPAWQRPLIVGDSLTFYLGKLIWPARLTVDYGRRPADALADPLIFLYWTIPAAIAVALVAFHRRVPWLALAFAILAIGVAPVTGITAFQMQKISTVTDHYLYFSMLGPAIGLAWITSRFPRRSVTVLAGIVLVALGVRASVQVAVWRDTFTLFEATLRAHPRSTVARTNLVVCYLEKLHPEPAMAQRYAREAYEIAPDESTVLWNYGVATAHIGQFEAAVAPLERCWTIAVEQGAPRGMRFELARAAYEAFRPTTRYDELIKWTERALANNPNDGPARALLIQSQQRKDAAATQPTTATAAPAPAPASAPSR